MFLAEIYELWSSAWPAGLTMLGLGGGFAVALLIASEKLKVEVDPNVEQVYQVLPHLDCGACGFAGCVRYAKALLADAELIGKCAPGGPETAAKIADMLNLQISDSGPQKRPIVHCRAHAGDKTMYAKYEGIQSCTAANALANAQAWASAIARGPASSMPCTSWTAYRPLTTANARAARPARRRAHAI